MSEALIIRDDHRRAVQWTPHAEELRQAVLESAALIFAVTNQDQREAAVAAQRALHTMRADIEKARKACKDPVLDFGRMIDNSAKQFDAPIAAEEMRLARIVGDYEAVLDQQRRAAEALRLKDLAELQRKEQEELVKANSIEQIDEIKERIAEQVRNASVPIEMPSRAEGQIVRKDLEVESVNEWTVVKMRPDLVRRIELDMVAIKQALARGETIPGIKAREVIKSSVRNMPKGATLEIGV